MKTYGKINYTENWKDQGKWTLQLEPHVAIRFKDMFRKANKSDVGFVRVMDSDAMRCDLEWFMSRYPLEISEQDAKRIADGSAAYAKKQDEVERLLIPEARFESYNLALEPRDYQKVAVEVVLKNNYLLCADDVGLGKSCIGVATAVRAGQWPAMVVCQTHLPLQWVDQFKKFAPDVRCHIIKSRTAYSLPEADVYIMPYSRIIGWDDVINKGTFKTVIYDECQELRRTASQKYITAMRLTQKANRVLGLSATPIYNFGSEIHSVMDVIKPGALGDWEEFRREWCSYSYSDDKAKVKDPKALGSMMREQFLMLRRTRKDVARELPPVNKVIHQVEYDENYAERAQVELAQIAARVVSGSFTERGQAARELDARARMMTGVAKARGVADYVRILLENGEKVLLVGWHREVYDIWLKELAEYGPVMYTGSESPTQKEESKNAFMRPMADPKIPNPYNHDTKQHERRSNLLLMSLRSGVGLDGLQEMCSLVVFGELDWSPGVHEQVVGRLNRDGQKDKVTALYLTTDNGTDPLMIDLLGLKSSQAHGIVNPNIEVEFAESNDDRIKQLANSILQRSK